MVQFKRSRKRGPGVLPLTEKREEYARLMKQGMNNSQACRALGIGRKTGSHWRNGRTYVNAAGERVRYPPVPGLSRPAVSARFLSNDERIAISDGLHQGRSLRGIAAAIGRSPSTISREVRRNTPSEALRYLPYAAEKQAAARRRRPGRGKIAGNDRLRTFIRDYLDLQWSPRQICNQLRTTFSQDPEMHIVHETIYKALYARDGGVFGGDPRLNLRTGRLSRRSRRRAGARRSRFSGPLIDQRPEDVAGRAVAGHWEGDLVSGQGNRSAIATLVERTSRYLILVHLGRHRDSAYVQSRIGQAMAWLPPHLKRSLTWDQGSEMSEYRKFESENGIPVYFCEPHSPWQRGTNENHNGLLRQYFPKGTDLSVHTPDRLAHVASRLNTRPRETMQWETPQALLDRLLRTPQHK
jgi:IS30 family transposase/DNA-binding CsgD family transcriptional regulator